MYKLEQYINDKFIKAILIDEEDLVFEFMHEVYSKLIEKGYAEDIDGSFWIVTKIF